MGCCGSKIDEEARLAAPVRRQVVLIPRKPQIEDSVPAMPSLISKTRFVDNVRVMKEDEQYMNPMSIEEREAKEVQKKEREEYERAEAQRQQAQHEEHVRKTLEFEKRQEEIRELKTLWELLDDCKSQQANNRDNAYTKGVEVIRRVLALHDKSHVYNALDKAGKFYTAFGALPEAIAIYERDLSETEKHNGKVHDNTASVLINLGHVEGLAKNHKRKRALLERAVEIQEKLHGPYHRPIAVTLGLGNLANAYGELGLLEMKQKALERSLDIYRRANGGDDELGEIATTLTWLGVTYNELADKYNDSSDRQKAKGTLEYALSLDEKLWGETQPDHPEMDITLSHLSSVYAELRDFEKQKEVLERALGIELALHGERHPQIPTTLINLANAYGESGNASKKKELLLRALDLQEKVLGRGAYVISTTLCNLGNVYADEGDVKGARESYERALQLNDTHHKDNINVAIILGNLGTLYCDLKEFELSKAALERAISIKEKHLGVDHPSVALSLSSLGQTCHEMGNNARFFEFMERAIAIMVLSPDGGEQHEDVIEWRKQIAIVRRQDERKKQDLTASSSTNSLTSSASTSNTGTGTSNAKSASRLNTTNGSGTVPKSQSATSVSTSTSGSGSTGPGTAAASTASNGKETSTTAAPFVVNASSSASKGHVPVKPQSSTNLMNAFAPVEDSSSRPSSSNLTIASAMDDKRKVKFGVRSDQKSDE